VPPFKIAANQYLTADLKSVLLHSNRLSCALPECLNTSTKLPNIVLFANQFDAPLPSWIGNDVRGSPFLSIPTAFYRSHYFQVLLAAVAGVLAMVLVSPQVRRQQALGATNSSRQLKLQVVEMIDFQTSCLRRLLPVATILTCVLIPLMMLSPNKWYECGSLGWTAADMYGSHPHRREQVFCGLIVMVSVLLDFWALYQLYQMRHEGSSPFLFLHRRGHHLRQWVINWCRLLGVTILWVLFVAILSLPTYIFVAAASLPANNIFGLDTGGWIVSLFNIGLYPIMMLAVSVFVIPLTARRCFGEYSALAEFLGLTLVVIILPALTTAYVDQNCYQGWLDWW